MKYFSWCSNETINCRYVNYLMNLVRVNLLKVSVNDKLSHEPQLLLYLLTFSCYEISLTCQTRDRRRNLQKLRPSKTSSRQSFSKLSGRTRDSTVNPSKYIN